MATFVALDASSGAPLHRQLYDALRRAIIDGHWRAGSRVPSSRLLAEQLDVSRNTVMSAFEQLLSEGYLVGKVGSGTYVADELPERALSAGRQAAGAPVEPVVSLSARGAALTAMASPFLGPAPQAGGSMAFRVGTPALDRFPAELWGRLMVKRWTRSADVIVGHSDPRGYGPLREAVADYVTTARGVRCEPDQVLIVSGSQQAMTLAAEVLLDPGDAVWMEDPGYVGARGALVAAGASIVPVPVDAEGIDVAAGIERGGEARLAVVTPAHHLPLGVPLSHARRVALLAWARRREAWIFEDDYDSELRYSGRPLAALQGMEGGGRVIYSGTFSKVLSPSLRLAYLIVPRPLLGAFLAAKAFADMRSPALEQAVLADFIAQGHFARHIRRMRVLYARRQAILLERARQDLAGLLELHPASAGMHLVGWLGPGQDDVEVSRRARAAGLYVLPLSMLRVASTGRGGLLLGYAAVPEAQIAEGVRRLRDALR